MCVKAREQWGQSIRASKKKRMGGRRPPFHISSIQSELGEDASTLSRRHVERGLVSLWFFFRRQARSGRSPRLHRRSLRSSVCNGGGASSCGHVLRWRAAAVMIATEFAQTGVSGCRVHIGRIFSTWLRAPAAADAGRFLSFLNQSSDPSPALNKL